MADNIFKRWTSKRVRELAAPGASLAEIAGMLARTQSAPMDRSELGSPASVNKITWQKAGRVTEPGRYSSSAGLLLLRTIWRSGRNIRTQRSHSTARRRRRNPPQKRYLERNFA